MNKSKLNTSIVCGYIVLALWIIITSFSKADYYPVTQGFIALLMLLIPPIMTRLLKFSVDNTVITIYYIFCLLSILLGSGLRWYTNFPGWDKILHFASGFLIAFIGVALFHAWKNIYSLKSKGDFLFLILYTISFTLAGATVWEFYEYILYIGLGIDALNVASTGVHDTLQDMIVCGLGGILTSFWIVSQIKKEKALNFLEIQWKK